MNATYLYSSRIAKPLVNGLPHLFGAAVVRSHTLHPGSRHGSLHAFEASALTAARAAPLKTIGASLGDNQPTGHRPGKKKIKKLVDINGHVSKELGNGMFQVKLENGVSVIAHLSGKIRTRKVNIIMGDLVTVELSPYDLTRGRITFRFKPGDSGGRGKTAANDATGTRGASNPPRGRKH